MIKDVKIFEIKRYEDERGWLAEIYRLDETDYRPAMSYVSVTKPGITRGPHEHVNQSDFFVFLGPGSFRVYLWDRRKNSETYKVHHNFEVGEHKPTAVIVPPGVVHGYKCISETAGWVINKPDKLYRGLNKGEEIDEIRWEADPNSPYKID